MMSCAPVTLCVVTQRVRNPISVRIDHAERACVGHLVDALDQRLEIRRLSIMISQSDGQSVRKRCSGQVRVVATQRQSAGLHVVGQESDRTHVVNRTSQGPCVGRG